MLSSLILSKYENPYSIFSSTKFKSLIDEEVTRIVDEALSKARKLLADNKNLLDNMARLLIEKETIYAEEVNLLMEGKSCEEIIEFMDKHEKELSEKPFERNLSNAPILNEEKAPTNNVETPALEENSDKRCDETVPNEEVVPSNDTENSTEETSEPEEKEDK